MARIVYLMGAGASVDCIPVVEKLAEGFKDIGSKLQDLILQSKDGQNNEMGIEIQAEEIAKDIFWLAEISENRASIDTVAKSFFLKDEFDSLRRLKIALSAYLQYQQIYQPLDKRYDLFLASIFNDSKRKVPKELKILSWNYDNQFELANEKFLLNKNQLDSRNSLEIVDKYQVIKDPKKDAFIFKLNGSAGIIFNKKIGAESYTDRADKSKIIQNHFQLKSIQDLDPGISFSWEDPEIIEQYLSNFIEKCEIIVTIGYSFPFFNREIDKMIFKKAENLKKVYIQNPRASEIEEKLQNLIDPIRRIKFVKDTSKNEFIIPYEL